MIRLLALSGSLRARSANTALLRAAALVSPSLGATVQLYEHLGSLPHFNPDLEDDGAGPLPAPVADLRARVGTADGLLICCPEYARGVPGSFKNLLDWLVGSHEFPGKPVALWNTSPRATAAQASLTLILKTMSARLVEPAALTLPLSGRAADFGPEEIATDPALAVPLCAALRAFI